MNLIFCIPVLIPTDHPLRRTSSRISRNKMRHQVEGRAHGGDGDVDIHNPPWPASSSLEFYPCGVPWRLPTPW